MHNKVKMNEKELDMLPLAALENLVGRRSEISVEQVDSGDNGNDSKPNDPKQNEQLNYDLNEESCNSYSFGNVGLDQRMVTQARPEGIRHSLDESSNPRSEATEMSPDKLSNKTSLSSKDNISELNLDLCRPQSRTSRDGSVSSSRSNSTENSNNKDNFVLTLGLDNVHSMNISPHANPNSVNKSDCGENSEIDCAKNNSINEIQSLSTLNNFNIIEKQTDKSITDINLKICEKENSLSKPNKNESNKTKEFSSENEFSLDVQQHPINQSEFSDSNLVQCDKPNISSEDENSKDKLSSDIMKHNYDETSLNFQSGIENNASLSATGTLASIPQESNINSVTLDKETESLSVSEGISKSLCDDSSLNYSPSPTSVTFSDTLPLNQSGKTYVMADTSMIPNEEQQRCSSTPGLASPDTVNPLTINSTNSDLKADLGRDSLELNNSSSDSQNDMDCPPSNLNINSNIQENDPQQSQLDFQNGELQEAISGISDLSEGNNGSCEGKVTGGTGDSTEEDSFCWETVTCIFCDSLVVEQEPKLLPCLHSACNKCLTHEASESIMNKDEDIVESK